MFQDDIDTLAETLNIKDIYYSPESCNENIGIDAVFESGDLYVFKAEFKANYKAGFYEITLYTNKSIVVPEELKPVRNQKGNKHG